MIDGPRPPRTAVAWGAATSVVTISTVLLVLVLGGGAPVRPPQGIADPGPIPAWVVAVLPSLRWVAALVATGLALAGSGASGPRWHEPARHAGTAAAAAWAALSLLQVPAIAWQFHGRASIWESWAVRGLIAQCVLAAAAAGAWRLRAAGQVVLAISLAALVPPPLTGHARTAAAPLVAGLAITVHVVAACTWVGGLLVLAGVVVRRRSGDGLAWWSSALPAYSRLALGCVIAVAASGTVLAIGRLDQPRQLLTSAYGTVIALKVIALGGLVAFGWLQRRHIVPRVPSSAAAFLLVAGTELTVMGLVFGLAAGLAQTPP